MEIEGEDGAIIELPKKTVFGRGSGLISDDKTVSRRHVAFEVETAATRAEPSVSFEVLGKNPVWVRRGEEDEIRVFRSSEKGRLSEGDRFCLSGNERTWFALRKIGAEDWETRVSNEEDENEFSSEFEGLDVSNIDPVKEFGFVVMGREFDDYPRHMIRDPKRWNWFLEENRKESSDDEEEEEEEEDDDKPGKSNKKKGVAVKKRKKREENGDEDWTGSESESEKEIIERLKSMRKEGNAKHYTRSKGRDRRVSAVDKLGSKKPAHGDDDDDDETLGGFIVGDSQVDQDVKEDEDDDEEEEEEFVDDDDD